MHNIRFLVLPIPISEQNKNKRKNARFLLNVVFKMQIAMFGLLSASHVRSTGYLLLLNCPQADKLDLCAVNGSGYLDISIQRKKKHMYQPTNTIHWIRLFPLNKIILSLESKIKSLNWNVVVSCGRPYVTRHRVLMAEHVSHCTNRTVSVASVLHCS